MIRTTPARRAARRAPVLLAGALLLCAGCTGTGDPSPPATSSPATSSPATAAPAWDTTVSRLVVDGADLTGDDLLAGVRTASTARGVPVPGALVLGPEPGGDHPGRLTAWFDEELTPDQAGAVRDALPAGAAVELGTEPGTDLDLAFTPRVPPSAPGGFPWSEEVSTRLGRVLADGGALAVFGAPDLGDGRYAFAYRGPRLSEEVVARLREAVGTAADGGPAGVVAQRGHDTP